MHKCRATLHRVQTGVDRALIPTLSVTIVAFHVEISARCCCFSCESDGRPVREPHSEAMSASNGVRCGTWERPSLLRDGLGFFLSLDEVVQEAAHARVAGIGREVALGAGARFGEVPEQRMSVGEAG